MQIIGYVLLISFIIFLYFAIVFIYMHGLQNTRPFGIASKVISNISSGKCSSISCSAIDPVSDPKYNMQQIVKQSILLEEHLANKMKRCRDCICKHYMHIIGLAEEAQLLATNKIDKYPLINECVELYNRLFNQWLKEHDADVERCSLNCCNELRTMRKKLIAVYFFNDEYSIKE